MLVVGTPTTWLAEPPRAWPMILSTSAAAATLPHDLGGVVPVGGLVGRADTENVGTAGLGLVRAPPPDDDEQPTSNPNAATIEPAAAHRRFMGSNASRHRPIPRG